VLSEILTCCLGRVLEKTSGFVWVVSFAVSHENRGGRCAVSYGEQGIPPQGPEFDAVALRVFRARIDQYCQEVNTSSNIAPNAIDVDIVVTTVFPVGQVRDTIREDALRYVSRQLGHDRVEVAFDIDQRLAFPGCQVEIQPLAPQDSAADAGDDQIEASGAGLLFNLAYQQCEWVYRLYPEQRWVPFGRQLGGSQEPAAVRLPDSAVFIPRGVLLGLWYQPGKVWLRRSRYRCEYQVRVDGHLLRPEVDVALESAGFIEYSRSGLGSTMLNYRMVLTEV
jgi:hypothetical protein